MSPEPGRDLGPYRIEAPLGAGGMGEVFKARDTRLNRTVAIKVLPAALAGDPELRQRFEREAQAIAALKHPHICVLHDIGHQDGVDFLVMEYLEGETLEARLKNGAMPLDRALQYAIEIAEALHHAHRAGITHRDLKPGNIMLTKGGSGSPSSQTKLLDFGLARVSAGSRAFITATAMPTTPRTITAEGTIVGTFQYMAPEQLEGRDADERTDIFAFGAVVYEMVTGRRAFAGDNRSSVIAAILRDEPPAISASQPVAPPALDLIVRTCLAKNPGDRFQSAHDVAAQLRWVRDDLAAPAAVIGRGVRRRSLRAWVLAAVAAAAIAAGAGYVAASRDTAPQPSLRRITFRRGTVGRALFAPDGHTIVYSASWDGKARQIMSVGADAAESMMLPLPAGTALLSISRTGELAVLTDVRGTTGTLGVVPLGGSGVRQILEQVTDAAWLPDGRSLAVIRDDRAGRRWLEFPIGKIAYETRSADIISLRVSVDGERVAFAEQDPDGGGWLSVVERNGGYKRWSRKWPGMNGGIAWTQSGDEVWFSASDVGLNTAVHAVNRHGGERIVERSLGSNRIVDLAADGRALLVHELIRAGLVGLAPGETHERDLSWLDFSRPKHLSDDGRTILFVESGAGGGEKPVTFIRGTDASPPVRLDQGAGLAISPDGRRVLAQVEGGKRLGLMPTGPGALQTIDTGNLVLSNQVASWMPDGRRIVFSASEPGRPPRVFVQSLDGGTPRPITPEGLRVGLAIPVSPDATQVIARVGDAAAMRYRVDGQPPLPILGLADGDRPMRWSRDGQSIFVIRRTDMPLAIWQIDVNSGRRRLWQEIAVTDPAGFDPDWVRVELSGDGKNYVYGYMRTLSDLYVAEGLR